jgi:hypothetical protein
MIKSIVFVIFVYLNNIKAIKQKELCIDSEPYQLF